MSERGIGSPIAMTRAQDGADVNINSGVVMYR
jgi:hypothetical protein